MNYGAVSPEHFLSTVYSVTCYPLAIVLFSTARLYMAIYIYAPSRFYCHYPESRIRTRTLESSYNLWRTVKSWAESRDENVRQWIPRFFSAAKKIVCQTAADICFGMNVPEKAIKSLRCTSLFSSSTIIQTVFFPRIYIGPILFYCLTNQILKTESRSLLCQHSSCYTNSNLASTVCEYRGLYTSLIQAAGRSFDVVIDALSNS